MSIDAINGTQAVGNDLPIKQLVSSQPANQAPVKAEAPEAGEKDVRKAARSLDEVLTGYNISLKFTRDDETGRTVVELVDYQSGETLRQMPSEVSLHLTAMFGKVQGRLFNRQA